MSLSFKDSLENAKNNTTIASKTMVNVDNVKAYEPVALSQDIIYDAISYSGNDGSWNQHSGYTYYSDFHDDKISIINDKKDIRVDDSQINITQEKNSQFIPFEMHRYYDGYDLTKAVLSIHYETANYNHGSSKPVNVIYNDEKIRFGWLVDGSAFVAGKLKFEIHAYGTVTGDDGVVKGYIWKTKPNESLNVLQSICDCEDVFNNVDDSWIQELIADISENIAEAIANYDFSDIINNLKDYYKKSETYNKEEVDNIVTQKSQVQIITWGDDD